MTQKDNSRCIEDARYKQDNLEAFELNNLKGLQMHLLQVLVVLIHLNQNDDVGGGMVNRENQNKYDQTKEDFVVGRADAVVQPLAVVIEAVRATVTGTAVLRRVCNVRFANVTFIRVILAVKFLPIIVLFDSHLLTHKLQCLFKV